MITNTCKRVRIDAPDQNSTSVIGIFCCNKAPRARLSPIFYARKTAVHKRSTACCPNPPCVAFLPLQIKTHLSVIARRPTWSPRSAVINKMARTIFAAGMFSYNLSSLGGKAPVSAHRPDAITGLRDRRFQVHNRTGVRNAQQRATPVPAPGLLQKHIWHWCQFRHPPAGKYTIWILIEPLFDRIINTDRIDPGCSGLHLNLRPVNARLVISEQARQVQPSASPVQPQLIRGKRHQHGAHAKVQPTGGLSLIHI